MPWLSETWKRRFLFFTNKPAASNAPSRPLVTTGSIPRPPSAPPIICTPILPTEGSSFAGDFIDRSRSTPPSVESPTSSGEPHPLRSNSDAESIVGHFTVPVMAHSGSSKTLSNTSTLSIGPASSTRDAETLALRTPIPFVVGESPRFPDSSSGVESITAPVTTHSVSSNVPPNVGHLPIGSTPSLPEPEAAARITAKPSLVEELARFSYSSSDTVLAATHCCEPSNVISNVGTLPVGLSPSVLDAGPLAPIPSVVDESPRFHSSSDAELTTGHLPIPVSAINDGSSSVLSNAGTLPVERALSVESVLNADTLAPTSGSTHADEPRGANDPGISSTQAISMQNFGDNNLLHVGDDNRDNKGIIVTGGIVQIHYPRGTSFISSSPLPVDVDFAPEPPSSRSVKLSPTTMAIIYINATQGFLEALFGSAINNSQGKPAEDIFVSLVDSIKYIVEMKMGERSAPQTVRDYITDLWSELYRERERLYNAENSPVDVDTSSLRIMWTLRLFLFLSHMGGYIQSAIVVEGVKKQMVEIQKDAEATAPRQAIKDIARVTAAYDEYVLGHQRRASCFEGTRQALLEEVGRWVANSEIGVFVIIGLAGIGKSTIAQTVAERADDVRLLGASFFFSRDEAERRTAKRFFTTIAFQLCVHDPEFAWAIESVLMTEQGKYAINKFPLEQLEMLILNPLRKLTPRKVVIVVDALDECDDEDAQTVLMGLNMLVQGLPSFKVILTTRPQQHLQLPQDYKASQKVFHLHNIEDKIVDGDIELYLRHKLSLQEVKVRLPNLRNPWSVSDDDIRLLVRAAGRLFIIASTAVLFILDKASTPASRLKILRTALDQDHTPFKTLNNFYTTILRNAVPKGCERDIVDRYQSVIGAIILIQAPLSLSALASLANMEVDDITAILGNLQPVILLGSNDIPVVYHKSFPDYIQDPERCADDDLRIDPRFHHTRMTIYCLRLLNRHLKQNILDLGDPYCFMENDKCLSIFAPQNPVQEKILSESRYACSYFANHYDCADIEDAELSPELGQFINEHLLHWLEALSWIKELDTAHRTLLTVHNQLKPISSHLIQLVADGLRFIGRFYDLIRQSALHTYHSALPLTPTETSLYMRYSKQMTFCRVQGGQKKWDGLVATLTLGHNTAVDHVVFSQNSALLACFVQRGNGLMAIHDSIAGIPLGRIPGRIFAIATDFSKAVAYEGGSITLYNVKGITPVATINLSATAVKLILSANGSRLVAALDDGTVCLWETEKYKLMNNFGGWNVGNGIAFSPDGSRIAFASRDGRTVKLLDATNGQLIADLFLPEGAWLTLIFSMDASRLACLSYLIWSKPLRIWDGRNGALIASADQGYRTEMAISADGSLIVTVAIGGKTLKLWSGNDLALLKSLNPGSPIRSFVIQNALLGIALENNFMILIIFHDINTDASIVRIPFQCEDVYRLALSPDRTRFATGNYSGEIQLWDVPSVIAPNSLQGQSSAPTQLAFSPDCSHLASGHEDGTIILWDTSSMAQVSAHKCHSSPVKTLDFSIDGGRFASGAGDRFIQLWDGKNGVPSSILGCLDDVSTVALSSSTLAAATKASITLWDIKTYAIIATLDQQDTSILAFSHNHSLLATHTEDLMTVVWDMVKHTPVITFECDTWRMRFLPDDSALAIQCDDYGFYLFDLDDRRLSKTFDRVEEAISQRGLCPIWHGFPMWADHNNVVGQLPLRENVFKHPSLDRIVGFKPRAIGSSMIALGYEDERILLITPI